MSPSTGSFSDAAARYARMVTAGDGTEQRVVSGADLSRFAEEFCISLREAEVVALDSGLVPERYLRNFRAYSLEEQAALLRSRVVMVGLGGLGGYVLEMLARMGVGHIFGADGDTFEESNLNRQLTSSVCTLNTSKAEAAAARVREVNPAVEFTACEKFLDKGAMLEALHGADVAADCLGGLDDRPALREACSESGVTLVTAAVAGTSGLITVVGPGEPSMADLLASGNKGDRGDRGAAEDALGTQAPPVATAASIQAQEVINVLLGRPVLSGGKALIFDLADMTFEKVGL